VKRRWPGKKKKTGLGGGVKKRGLNSGFCQSGKRKDNVLIIKGRSALRGRSDKKICEGVKKILRGKPLGCHG